MTRWFSSNSLRRESVACTLGRRHRRGVPDGRKWLVVEHPDLTSWTLHRLPNRFGRLALNARFCAHEEL